MSFIEERDIIDESKDCFLTYAEEVLTDRAIPAVEDGLLSAQRKILWTMEDYLKMTSRSKTKKCNAIIGSTLATSYFHGDQSCYGVLCKMSQDFLMRYPLISGQGSLGTQESNDMFASSRYTEAKPSIYTDLMMNDFNKNVVPKKETYNGEFMEPVVLPGSFPNALCNGRQAIGISMAHNSAPNNLTEVCNGIIHYIEKDGNITLEELMKDIPGPDFPLGGQIINIKDIKTAFKTGKSNISLKIRGDYKIEKNKIIFTSIPYRTYRNKIKEQINKNIDELDKIIIDFDDESNVGENKLVFTVKDESSINTALNKLFALTDLQTTLSYNMNFIVNGTPKLCSLYDLIKYYVLHQEEVLLKATSYNKEKAESRLHILNGLIAAIDKIDEVISLIKQSADKNEARKKIMLLLKVDEIQANAILDMKLSKLTHIDKNELIQEKKEKEVLIAKYNRIINEKDFRNRILIENINLLKEKYGDDRRTKLCDLPSFKEEKEIEFVEPIKCIVVMTEGGLIKRIPSNSFKIQKRNGKGIKNLDEVLLGVISTNTIDNLMLFTNKGKMYKLLVDNVPEGTNTSKGIHINNLVKLEPQEKIIAISSFERKNEAKYVIFITKKGKFKKTSINEYKSVKKNSGIVAIKLNEGDSIAKVVFADEEDFIAITEKGMSIHFETKDIAAIGRNTAGVNLIKLNEDDLVLTGFPVKKDIEYIAIIAENGLGKKIKINEFPIQGRAGKGVCIYKGAEIKGAEPIAEKDNLLIIGNPNNICISSSELPILSRTSLGNQVIKNAKVQSIIKL